MLQAQQCEQPGVTQSFVQAQVHPTGMRCSWSMLVQERDHQQSFTRQDLQSGAQQRLTESWPQVTVFCHMDCYGGSDCCAEPAHSRCSPISMKRGEQAGCGLTISGCAATSSSGLVAATAVAGASTELRSTASPIASPNLLPSLTFTSGAGEMG